MNNIWLLAAAEAQTIEPYKRLLVYRRYMCSLNFWSRALRNAAAHCCHSLRTLKYKYARFSRVVMYLHVLCWLLLLVLLLAFAAVRCTIDSCLRCGCMWFGETKTYTTQKTGIRTHAQAVWAKCSNTTYSIRNGRRKNKKYTTPVLTRAHRCGLVSQWTQSCALRRFDANRLLRFTNTATNPLYMSAPSLFQMENVNGGRLNVCVRLFYLLKPELLNEWCSLSTTVWGANT